ncbi:MAG TPA: TatD family hydrolase, partial [Thermoplasmataceae archaeon]|nr:TatD family hydrolase [Thermoplasmataceae archaeon]
MELWDIIFDNHMHLREDGYNIEAARQFEHSGGTAFNLVNLPNHELPAADYYENVYRKTLKLAEMVRRETGVKVAVTLGPYPLDYLHFSSHVGNIKEFILSGIDRAVDLILKGEADALGEIGRPHFVTDEKTVEDANDILEYAMEKCSDQDIPIILHTEDLTGDSYKELGEMARKAGFDTGKLIKHHAHPKDFSIDSILLKSVLATRKNVRESLIMSRGFFLETDYVDDRSKPGKVIPADSVPKRALM